MYQGTVHMCTAAQCTAAQFDTKTEQLTQHLRERTKANSAFVSSDNLEISMLYLGHVVTQRQEVL